MKSISMSVALVALLALGAAGAACGGKDEAAPPQTTTGAEAKKPGKVVDLTDSKEVERVALESLQAYRDKNLEKLADLGPPKAKEKLIFLEPRNPHYEELLGDSSWRMKALKAWDGKLIKIARGVDDNALAYFYEDDQYRYAVEVRKDDGRWQFFDLKQQPKNPPAPGAEPAPAPTPAPAP